MVKAIETVVLILTVIITIFSIAGITLTSNNSEDYRSEMGEDCSYGGSLCKRSRSNPYTTISGDLICKHHIAEKGNKAKIVGSGFKHPEKVNDNLFKHIKFYAMVENALILVPICQIGAFIIYALIYFIRLTTFHTSDVGAIPAYIIYTFCQIMACSTFYALVFGLALMEVDFGDCLESNTPEFMLTDITFAKLLFWGWFSAVVALALAMVLIAVDFCAPHPQRPSTAIKCIIGFGGMLACIAILLLMLSSLIGFFLYLILWFVACKILYIYIYI